MPIPTPPDAAKWKSAKDADKDVTAAIEKLGKAHGGINAKALGVDAPKTMEDATKRQKELDAAAKGVQAAIEAADALVKAGTDTLGPLKKDKAKAEQVKLLTAILNQARDYAKLLEGAYDEAQAAASDAIERFEAQQKKAEAAAKAAEKDGESDGESDALANEKDDKKFFANLKSKYKGFFATLRNVGGKMKLSEVLTSRNAQVKFRMVSAGKTFGVGISKNSFGEGELKIARRMADLSSGGKDSKGIIYWHPDDKVFVFEGANVPTGGANATALKIALKTTIGYAPKLRLQKPGEKGEDSEGPEELDPDTAEGAAQAKAPEAVAQAAEVARAMIAKLDGFKAKLDQRVKAGGADAEKLTALDKGIREEAARNPEIAKRLLDGLIKLLGSAPAADSSGGLAPNPDATAVPIPALQKAHKDWVDARERYRNEVRDLASSLDTLYREELSSDDAAVRKAMTKAVTDAKNRLNATAELIGPELGSAIETVLSAPKDAQRAAANRARAELAALIRRLGADPVFKSLDGKNNELKPDMKVVQDVQATLKSVSDVLKI